jgi:hypothetical protein
MKLAICETPSNASVTPDSSLSSHSSLFSTVELSPVQAQVVEAPTDEMRELSSLALKTLCKLLERTDTPAAVQLRAALAVLAHERRSQSDAYTRTVVTVLYPMLR